jgi:hypothetical protein
MKEKIMKQLVNNIKNIFVKQSKELEELSMNLNDKIKDFFIKYLQKKKIEKDEFLMIGIRNKEGLKTDVVNDFLGFIHNDEIFITPGSTDPGVYWITSSERIKQGTFHLKSQFHKNIWCIGTHKGYEALVNDWRNCLPTEGWRDANFNFEFDAKDLEVRGHFGINFHRMHPISIIDRVGKYSAGCQVVQDPKAFQYILKSFKDTNMYKKDKKAAVCYLLVDLEELPKDIQQELYA